MCCNASCIRRGWSSERRVAHTCKASNAAANANAIATATARSDAVGVSMPNTIAARPLARPCAITSAT